LSESSKKLEEYLNKPGSLKLISIEPSSHLLSLILRKASSHVVMCSSGTCLLALKVIDNQILPFENFRDFFIKVIRLMKENKDILIYYTNDLMYLERNIEVKLKGMVVSAWLLHNYAHMTGRSVIVIGYKTLEGKLPYEDYLRPWADILIDIKEEKVGNRRLGWKVTVEGEMLEEFLMGDEA